MAKKIILLLNTGTPDAPTPEALRSYLDNFLMDKYVVQMPYLLRWLVMRNWVVPRRAPRSAEKYKLVFTDGVSPLLKHTKDLAERLDAVATPPVYFGMRYSSPTATEVVDRVLSENEDLEEVLFVPLFPQYAESTFDSVNEHYGDEFRRKKATLHLTSLPPYYNHQKYVETMVAHLQSALPTLPDKIVFSYHGLPISYLKKYHKDKNFNALKGECCANNPTAAQSCYQHQCYNSVREITQRLGLADDRWEITFQSRFGHSQWLQPYTAQRLAELPKEGVKSIAVVAPSFITDCLETLEELDIEGRATFMAAGGEAFQYVETLNASERWVEAFHDIVMEG